MGISVRESNPGQIAGTVVSRSAETEPDVPLSPTPALETEMKARRSRVLSGSAVLLAGLGLVTLINFAYNIAVARFLGPTAFGHATAVYTLLILISAVTLSFQIVSAKVVAQQNSLEGKSTAYRGFHGSAWVCGILVALLLLLFQKTIAGYLNLHSPI